MIKTKFSMFISTTSELENACKSLMEAEPKFVAVDTEFTRNGKTYYPILSLIQVSYGINKNFIVDALAPEINLSAMGKILSDTQIIKVFHGCRQDIESLLTVFKDAPKPIFDTQIAAMLCYYYHDFIGYAKLVEQFKNVTLDKKKTKTSDWSKRPLSEEQLNYAINDVTHLYDLYHILYDKLIERCRLDWFLEEMEELSNTDRYIYSPKNAWKRFKVSQQGYDMFLIKTISEWQETLAQNYNVNRNRIINDSVVKILSEKRVDYADEMLCSLKKYAKTIQEEDLLEYINIFNSNKNIVEERRVLTTNIDDQSIFDVLSIYLHNKCKNHNISNKLIASKEEIKESVHNKTSSLFKGWRNNFFGQFIQSFLNSNAKIEILIKNDKMEIYNSLAGNFE
ncbi:ribonuclease D [Wolbachia endosymbiont of Pentidionis agamae]|uniref:ribonuclease D n=1 Tax=Wolbachia endosymbiont of Pentidionis agamae TaxID=3110435 RepID=UPI002FD36355